MYSSKFNVNCDYTTCCAKCLSNLILKCYTNTLWKVTHKINTGRLPKDYLLSERVLFLPKALLEETKWSETYDEYSQLALQEEKLYAERGLRLKNLCLSNLLCICHFLFETNVNKAKYSIYGNLLPVFSVTGLQFAEKWSQQLLYFYPSIFSCNWNPCTW